MAVSQFEFWGKKSPEIRILLGLGGLVVKKIYGTQPFRDIICKRGPEPP